MGRIFRGGVVWGSRSSTVESDGSRWGQVCSDGGPSKDLERRRWGEVASVCYEGGVVKETQLLVGSLTVPPPLLIHGSLTYLLMYLLT